MRAVALSLLAGALLCSSALHAAPRRPMIDRPVPEVKFEAVALRDALDFFRDVTQLNLHVDWKALAEVGVTPETSVSTRVRDVTVRKALAVLLQDAAGAGVLTFYPDNGVLTITTKDAADRKLVTRVYPVDDLLLEVPDFGTAPQFSLDSDEGGGGGDAGGGGGTGGGGGGLFGGGNATASADAPAARTKQERADQLVQLLQNVIEPQVWQDNGGPASMRYFRGNLVVTAPRGVHEKLGGR
ncbi:MAG TPA: hypothetical protein VK324_14930 [Tepidisphaeraceae bacterium]|nr:hypothetical protein [Tepidisphaeraceae bacterium]